MAILPRVKMARIKDRPKRFRQAYRKDTADPEYASSAYVSAATPQTAPVLVPILAEPCRVSFDPWPSSLV
jgi:hypothetical protein